MCFCSRRAYNIENIVDIKNLKNFIMHQFVDFKYRIWWYHDWIFFKILHNMHFDHVIWHHNAFCNIFVWKMSLCVCCDIINVEAYFYWVLGVIIVLYHKKFQNLNINKSYFCIFDGIRRNFNCRSIETKTAFYSLILFYKYIVHVF
jgi:hypothetical protein